VTIGVTSFIEIFHDMEGHLQAFDLLGTSWWLSSGFAICSYFSQPSIAVSCTDSQACAQTLFITKFIRNGTCLPLSVPPLSLYFPLDVIGGCIFKHKNSKDPSQ